MVRYTQMKERFSKKGLPNTAWNIRCIKKQEDDPRRHRSRCIYYEDGKCINLYEVCCSGSSHCRHYAVITGGRSKKEERELIRKVEKITDSTGVMESCLGSYRADERRAEKERKLSLKRKREKRIKKKKRKKKASAEASKKRSQEAGV